MDNSVVLDNVDSSLASQSCNDLGRQFGAESSDGELEDMGGNEAIGRSQPSCLKSGVDAVVVYDDVPWRAGIELAQ